jgi:hypothetical protein
MKNITITTNWLDGYTEINGVPSVADEYATQQEEYNVEFSVSPTKYRGLHAGLYVDVTGTVEELKTWWVEGYNGNQQPSYSKKEFDNRLGNSQTPWGSINFESDER